MNRRSKTGVFLLVAALAGVAGFHFNKTSLISPVADGANGELLSQSLPDLSGKVQRLSQWGGNVLVVNFWASWCAPCREEIPALMKVQRQHASNGVQTVGIAIDNATNVHNYAVEMHIDYVLLIGGAEIMKLTQDLGNRKGVLPFTVVLDRSGKVVYAHAGPLTETLLRPILAPLI